MRKMEIIDWREDEIKFKLSGEDGSYICYEGLTTFETEDGKLYILYTDNSLDDNGNTRIFSGILHEEEMIIEAIVSEDELTMINAVITKLCNLVAGGVDFDSLNGEWEI